MQNMWYTNNNKAFNGYVRKKNRLECFNITYFAYLICIIIKSKDISV